MDMPISLILCVATAVSCPLLGIATIVTARAERSARRGDAFTERSLYERGREAARVRDERNASSPETPFERTLQSAGVPLGMTSCRIVAIALIAIAFVMGCFLVGSVLGGCAALAILVLAVCESLRHGMKKRRDLFDVQLARALPQMSAGVRGSLTLERAFRVAAAHVDQPLKGECARVLADVAYGMSFPLALEGMAERTQHADVKMLAAAIKIRQRRGGSAAAVLGMISDRVNARLKASRELRAEIASARMAQWFVAGAMPILFLIMYASNDDFARFYAGEPLGWHIAAAAAVCEVVGLLMARRIVSLNR